MENKEIARVFKLVGQVMELHGENKFKTRSYSNASFQISKYPRRIADLPVVEYETIPGVGKNLVPKLEQLLTTGEMQYLNQWLEQTPSGVIEMLSIKGLGPSKVRTIWKDMGLESPGELLYACNENRLVDLKGFGSKTQSSVKQAIEFILEHKSKHLYASAEGLIDEIIEYVRAKNADGRIQLVGEAAMKNPVLESLDFVVSENVSELPDTSDVKIKVNFESVPSNEFEKEAFLRTASKEHLSQLDVSMAGSAEEVYASNGLPFIVPEMRIGLNEFNWVKQHEPASLIDNHHLKGCLHNHSTYSDGMHSLEDMALFLKAEGYDYLGISDHSKTAVYAGGLKEEDILRQHEEIDLLNNKLAPFQIFKGIESDILSNGSLDYGDDLLNSFDFVVASIHSAMKMDEKTATERLIKAIEHPSTKILGHPTGRLLLSRPGYPINHQKVIDACTHNGVSIELNSNPMRLDIDYTWIPQCLEKGVLVSLNPDAHRKEGFAHMRFGVMAARRGGLVKEQTLNAKSAAELMEFFTA